jgi:hypothetical protein
MTLMEPKSSDTFVGWGPQPVQYPVDLNNLEHLSFPSLIASLKTVPSSILTADAVFLPNSPSLFSFQKMTMCAMDDHIFTWFQACRGAAKSYGAARYCAAKGLTNKIKVCFTAPTYRQAMHLFEYVVTILEENYDSALPCNLQHEVKRVVRGSMRSVIELSNGTEFVALPMGTGEGIRGERADILVVDEFFNMAKSMYQSHILPFLQGHKKADGIRKLILLTSAEFQDSFAFTVLSQRFLPKIVAEDILSERDPNYKRKYCVIDVNIDDVLASGYNYDLDVLEQTLAGATEEERQQAMYNRWIGISGQFFPGNLFDKMARPDIHIEHEAESGFDYCMSIDVATAPPPKGDFFVVDVWKMLPERKKMALVNSYWNKGLSSDEMASKIHHFNRKFGCSWIVMDKGGGGLYVRDSLMKKKLTFKDGTEENIEVPILEHNENRIIDGQRKLVFNRSSDEMLRSGFADDRSRGGEHIHSEDIMLHLLHDGLRQKLNENDMPILCPAGYLATNDDGEFTSNSKIFDNIKESIFQLRHLTIKIQENVDGTREVVKTKVNKVPAYVWKNSQKDGASAFIYGYIAYRIFYKGRTEVEPGMPIVLRNSQSPTSAYEGLADRKPGQTYQLGK